MSVTCNLIVIYDTYVKMTDDNRCPFHLFEILIFWVVRGSAKNGPKCQNILSDLSHISGTIHHMMMIFGTHV